MAYLHLPEVTSSSPVVSATKETSFVYQDKRGFSCFLGQKQAKIPEKLWSEQSSRPFRPLFFHFQSQKCRILFGFLYWAKRSGNLWVTGFECLKPARNPSDLTKSGTCAILYTQSVHRSENQIAYKRCARDKPDDRTATSQRERCQSLYDRFIPALLRLVFLHLFSGSNRKWGVFWYITILGMKHVRTGDGSD